MRRPHGADVLRICNLLLSFVSMEGRRPSNHSACRAGGFDRDRLRNRLRCCRRAHSPPPPLPWRPRASAPQSGKGTERAHPCGRPVLPRPAQRKPGFCAMLGKLCHSTQMRPAARSGSSSGIPTKFHSAVVRTSTNWAAGIPLQQGPGFGRAQVSGISKRVVLWRHRSQPTKKVRGREHRSRPRLVFSRIH